VKIKSVKRIAEGPPSTDVTGPFRFCDSAMSDEFDHLDHRRLKDWQSNSSINQPAPINFAVAASLVVLKIRFD
jgi:hypothetical protein